jgi:hypothetical protein
VIYGRPIIARGFIGGVEPRPNGALYPWLIASIGICAALSLLPFLAELPIYLAGARELSEGRLLQDGFFPVGYPALLMPSYRLAGVSGIIAFQAALYAATVWLFWRLLDRSCRDKTLVQLVTALVALHPYLLLNIQRINDNAVNVLLVLVLVAALIHRPVMATTARALAVGAAMGLFVAVRPNVALLALLPLAGLVVRSRPWQSLAAYAAGGLVLLAAISLLATGNPFFVPGNGPYNLFAGTNPLSAAAMLSDYNGEGSIVPALAAAGIDPGNPYAVSSDTYFRLAFGFAADHPVEAVELILLKLVNLFRPDWQFADDALEVAAQTAIALPLAAWLGVVCLDPAYRRSRRGRWFLALVALFLLPFALTNSDPRFRLPLDIAFVLEAAIVIGNGAWLGRLWNGLQLRRA